MNLSKRKKEKKSLYVLLHSDLKPWFLLQIAISVTAKIDDDDLLLKTLNDVLIRNKEVGQKLLLALEFPSVGGHC